MADGGEDLRDLIVSTHGLDRPATESLLRAHARGDLNDADLQRTAKYLDEGRIDQADVRRMVKMLDGSDSDVIVHEDISATNLLDITERGADLSETSIVTRPKNTFRFDQDSGQTPETVWLEKGNSKTGWEHIQGRHITKELIGEQDATSYFPIGQTIRGRMLGGPMDSKRDIRQLIKHAVEEGTPSQGPRQNLAEYSYGPDPERTGISDMTVRVSSDGEIETAFPEDGPAVRTWIKEEQEWVDRI